MWSHGVLVVTVACAVADMLSEVRRRRQARRQAVIETQVWENEGGAVLPPARDRGAPSRRATSHRAGELS